MSNRKVSSFTVRFFWPLMLCLGLGLGLMALVGLMSYRSDLHLASQNLTDATQYVKQQRTAYDRFNDTSVTKSLMRVIENAQQIDREIQYKIALTGESTGLSVHRTYSVQDCPDRRGHAEHRRPAPLYLRAAADRHHPAERAWRRPAGVQH